MRNSKFWAWILAAALLLAGYALTTFGWIGLGSALFVAFPVAAGYALASFGLTRRRSVAIGGVLVALGVLALFGFEGVVCIGLALPIMLPLVLLGHWLQRRTIPPPPADDHAPLDHPLVLTLPLLVLLAGGAVERFFSNEPSLDRVTTRATLPYPAPAVFDHVKAMDTLDAEEPLLLALGLPHPYKCELYGDSVGAHRVCRFREGTIETRVTRFEPGRALAMDVVNYRLPAGGWFAFEHADYTFEEHGGATTITRTTAYRSQLRPRFYWRAVERWTIGQEHGFVLESLRKNLAR
jgi:hypothetical protein